MTAEDYHKEEMAYAIEFLTQYAEEFFKDTTATDVTATVNRLADKNTELKDYESKALRNLTSFITSLYEQVQKIEIHSKALDLSGKDHILKHSIGATLYESAS
jgi:hypothetical protein